MSYSMNHLSQDLLLSVLDDEVTPAQRLECENHLAVCEACREKVGALSEFSADIELAVQAKALPDMSDVRRNVEKAIELRSKPVTVFESPGKVMRRFGWGMGIAATLAFGILLAPRHDLTPSAGNAEVLEQEAASVQAATIEVDGETFFVLPYSNADLATAAPHIVQMQVPVSSLADLGIVLEPVMNRVSNGPEAERSVLADVLVGADGQPRGVHVLGQE